MFSTTIETKSVMEAQIAGGHAFEAEKVELYTNDGQLVPNHVGILNGVTGEYLGTVGKGWEPVQPDVLYGLADELIQSTDGHINSVFSLREGAVIGISFTLAQREYIPNDPVSLNFIMLNAFDGTHGLAGHSTTNRIACMNQCNTSNKIYNLRHTKNVLNRVEVVKNMLKFYQNEIVSFDSKMTSLVRHRMNQDEAVRWFRSLFPEATTRRSISTLENQVATFLDCLLHGRGSEIPGVRGTSYGAFQALTEYINHHRSTRIHGDRDPEEVRFESIHFGTGNTIVQKGLGSLISGFMLSESDFALD